ncbi:hypothetical protein RUND412_007090 [Rhizina undulata]
MILDKVSWVWDTETITRNDVNPDGEPKVDQRSLDATGGLALIFHYLNSTMLDKSLEQIFGIIPSTCSRYLRFGMRILLQMLKGIEEAKISWLQTDKQFAYFFSLIN